jgi:hypothetical protein
MKKLFLLMGFVCLQFSMNASTGHASGKFYLAPVSATQRARAHFKLNYKEVSDASWYNAPDNSMYCIFHQNNMVNRVFYDGQGYWRFTLVSYSPSLLNEQVKELVNSHFEGYHISYINEIRSQYDEPIYMINIENAGSIKVLKVANDEIEVKQDLIKE